jgi:hypothetical protein
MQLFSFRLSLIIVGGCVEMVIESAEGPSGIKCGKTLADRGLR